MALWRSKSNKLLMLKKVPLFDGLSDRQIEQISRLADEIEVPAGKRLATAGETGRELFLIVDGQAVVKTRGGRSVRMGKGDFFGEMSLLDGGPRSANVDAETAMRLFVIGSREFWALLAAAPPVTRKIMSALSVRLREANAAFSPCT